MNIKEEVNKILGFETKQTSNMFSNCNLVKESSKYNKEETVCIEELKDYSDNTVELEIQGYYVTIKNNDTWEFWGYVS